VPKRSVDEPPLPFTERDAPTVPNPGVSILPVPLKVTDVPGFEIDGVPIMGTYDGDAWVGTPFGWSDALSEEERGNHSANDSKPTMFHDRSADTDGDPQLK